MVERGTPGLVIGKEEDKMGQRASRWIEERARATMPGNACWTPLSRDGNGYAMMAVSGCDEAAPSGLLLAEKAIANRLGSSLARRQGHLTCFGARFVLSRCPPSYRTALQIKPWHQTFGTSHLESKIEGFIKEWNQVAHPFAWSEKSFQKILAKVDAALKAAA
ncbi:MAG TPA: hypothetical protein VH877_11820 [Polyangia bacterium]|nr:hypothetical protein [Polyangia bacterium]